MESCRAPLSMNACIALVSSFTICGLIWAIYNYRLVKKINVRSENLSEDMSLHGV